ncbi:MAG: ABC transporter substrate-binding protein [Chloroflexi bacterium]|nr:MAG: ABC transporter substrate-binding protein [Chloroflexota bacterium]
MTADKPKAPVYAPTRRMFLRDATLVSIGMLAAACQPGTATPSGGTGKKGGEFHGAWPYDLPPKGHYNYFTTGSILATSGVSIYGDLMLPSLAAYRWSEDKYDYWLAESHAMNGDNLDVKLRKGLKWDDGKPFTSKDVWTTYWVGRMEGFGIWSYIDDVTMPDDNTVRFHFKTPTTLGERLILRANGIRADSQFGDFAKRAEALYKAGKTTTSDEVKALRTEKDNLRPAGPLSVGPYKMDTSTLTAAQVTFVRNAGGLFGDSVTFDKVVVYQGETAAIAPLVLSGDVDYATHGFSVAQDRSFQDAGLKIARGPLFTGPAIYFNWDKTPEFQDPRLRQAVAMAINRVESGTIAYGQSAKPPKYMTGFPDELVPNWIASGDQSKFKSYDYNVAAADQLMKDAGFAKVDGIYAKGGKKLAYELYFPSDFTDWSAAADHAQKSLNTFGIKITPRGAPRATHLPDTNDGKFEITLNAWGIGNPHPQASLARPFREYNTTNAGGGMHYPTTQKWSGGTIDFEKLLVDAAAGTDLAKQKTAITQISLAFNEILPCVPLWQRLGNNPLNDKKRVVWPDLSDKIYQNPGGDNFTIIMLMNGTLHSI